MELKGNQARGKLNFTEDTDCDRINTDLIDNLAYGKFNSTQERKDEKLKDNQAYRELQYNQTYLVLLKS